MFMEAHKLHRGTVLRLCATEHQTRYRSVLPLDRIVTVAERYASALRDVRYRT
jgi:hypothetical protein